MYDSINIKGENMKVNIAKITVGILGLLGILMCGGSVVAWTLKIGTPQSLVGAILIVFLCSCSAVSCAYLIWEGRK